MTSTAGVEEHPASRLPRLNSLTGLRFLAAFVVFLDHTHGLLGGTLETSTSWLASPGYVGVSFFFILSGFVLTWSQRADATALSFYRRRFARIYPSHLVTWLIAAVPVVVAGSFLATLPGGILGVFLLQDWVPQERVFYAWNGVAWSLSAEAFFYLLYPAFGKRQLGLTSRARWILVAVLAALIVVAAALASPHVRQAELTSASPSGAWLWLVYNCPAVRVLEFGIGALLASNVRAGFRLPGFWAWVALAAATYVVCGLWPTTFSRVAITLVPFCAVIVAGASRDIAGRPTAFSRRWIVRLGEWSFAFYLVHQIVVHAARRFTDPITSPGFAILLTILLLAVSIVAAWALHAIVEVPFERRLSGRTPRSSAPPKPS